MSENNDSVIAALISFVICKDGSTNIICTLNDDNKISDFALMLEKLTHADLDRYIIQALRKSLTLEQCREILESWIEHHHRIMDLPAIAPADVLGNFFNQQDKS